VLGECYYGDWNDAASGRRSSIIEAERAPLMTAFGFLTASRSLLIRMSTIIGGGRSSAAVKFAVVVSPQLNHTMGPRPISNFRNVGLVNRF
jgi:hypothetical protein